ncbi:MAG: hypothetical protein INR64_03580, partial [Caulobacteraceae bacterium]|nr:hypothetical protein [Caulobacter sp.]
MSPAPSRGLDARFAASVNTGLAHLQGRRFTEAAAALGPLASLAPGEPDLRRAY